MEAPVNIAGAFIFFTRDDEEKTRFSAGSVAQESGCIAAFYPQIVRIKGDKTDGHCAIEDAQFVGWKSPVNCPVARGVTLGRVGLRGRSRNANLSLE
ncbi:MAG TPA: hypothetical protein VGO67_09340 [Verrucomicrobiae bacterium]